VSTQVRTREVSQESSDLVRGRADEEVGDAARYRREALFHDAKVAAIGTNAPPAPLDPWVAAMLRSAGQLQHQRVLEIGCGSGDLAIRLANAGADLTVLDISQRSVETTHERVKQFAKGASIRTVVAPAEATGLPAGSFDLVLGNRVIHHLDVALATTEIARLLAPSGRALFVENSGLNPLLMLARQHFVGHLGIPRFGTEDEHPLTERDFDQFRRRFKHVELLFPSFRFLDLIDRQVFRYKSSIVSRVCSSFDATIDRWLPVCRRYGYLVVIEVAGPRPIDESNGAAT
jgi:SAM-dependent methyltransferase